MAYPGLEITPPFFEIGPKAYMFGSELVDLARRADALSRAFLVQVIITPQCVDLPLVAREVETVLVFAQHMDALERGRGGRRAAQPRRETPVAGRAGSHDPSGR